MERRTKFIRKLTILTTQPATYARGINTVFETLFVVFMITIGIKYSFENLQLLGTRTKIL